MWMWWGNYGISAVSVAVEHCLAGKKAQSQYIKEPILSNFATRTELTEAEKQREVDRFFNDNERMRKSWKRKHEKELPDGNKSH